MVFFFFFLATFKSVLLKVKKMAEKNANDPEFVKAILNVRKENSVLNLITLIPFVRADENHDLRETYLKIIPVFLSYAEIFVNHVQEAIYLIELIQHHPLFVKDKRLFDEWLFRFNELITNSRKSDRVRLEEQTKYRSRFVVISGTNFVDTIGYAEIEYFNSFHKYLKAHKLHKYLYFFCNLSHVEIASINERNIRDFENKVNIFPMTNGARNAILRKLGELNSRHLRLQTLCERKHYNHVEKVLSALNEIKTILRTPVHTSPLCHSESDNLPNLIARALYIIRSVIFKNWSTLNEEVEECARTLFFVLKRAWSCYYFESEQKKKFNAWKLELLHRLKAVNVQLKYVQPKYIQQKYIQQPTPNVRRPNDVDELDRKLDEVIQYLEKVILQ